MFKLFTKNLDTMQGANGKSKLDDLSNLNKLKKEELGTFFGGDKNKHYDEEGGNGKRKRPWSLFDIFSTKPCESDTPQ